MSELTQSLAPKKLRPWHELAADMWIADPTLSQGDIARALGVTQAWLSIVVNSDGFKQYLAQRKEAIVDPLLRATVEDRLTSVANRAAEKFLERLEMAGGSISNGDLLRAIEVSTKGLGMGPQTRQPALTQNLYVIPAPARPATSAEWGQIVDAEMKEKK